MIKSKKWIVTEYRQITVEVPYAFAEQDIRRIAFSGNDNNYITSEVINRNAYPIDVEVQS